MPTTPQPVHLNNRHRDTLLQILQHPVGHSIEWQAVHSLLEAVASVEESHDGKFVVTLGAESETFERPRQKDIDSQQVVNLRRMLRNAGYGALVEEAEDKGKEV
jgi:rubrerythrin